MKLEDAKQLAQTTSVAEANEFLAKGFVIYKTISAKVYKDGQEWILPMHCLALFQNGQTTKG